MERAWMRWTRFTPRRGALACVALAAALPACGPAPMQVDDAHDVEVVAEGPRAPAYAPPPPAYYAPAGPPMVINNHPAAAPPTVVHYPPAAGPPTIVIVQCPAATGPSCPAAAPPPVVMAPPPPPLPPPALPAVVFPPRPPAPPPLPPAVEDPRIRSTVRANYHKFQRCYEKGLQRDPNLQGRVVVRLKIDPDGEVDTVRDHGSTMPNRRVVKCILDVYEDIEFPESYGMTAVYPLDFAPRR